MNKDRNPFEETEVVVSMTECTGLMPALPQDGRQDTNFAQLYAIHKAAKPRKQYRKK